MPPARTPPGRCRSISCYQATTGTPRERAARDVLPYHHLARPIDDFLTDLADANKQRNTIPGVGNNGVRDRVRPRILDYVELVRSRPSPALTSFTITC
jgi:hypothetical protein